MTSKNVLITLIGVIIIGSAVYFAMSKRATAPIAPPPITTQNTEKDTKAEVVAPSAQASTNDIIDYIVDGQSKDEMNVTQEALKENVAPTSEPTISTNF
jgi:hypothetical protein